jgi:hypothetical protein
MKKRWLKRFSFNNYNQRNDDIVLISLSVIGY